ncbi:MAG: histidine kinase [Lysobacterales bacterium RIFOXYD1_FULL_69_11]|nr:MAG: histidine kinase [Xanthomonadales bacterium RIFOXYA1_FULL_69_10]OHE87848.1 MAG: histidine kinase [Xanthomonadales bacterium RIFOXYD1_FULL_69_11]
MPETVRPNAWSRWRMPLLVALIVAIVVGPFIVLSDAMDQSQQAAAIEEHTREVESTVLELLYDTRDLEAAALALASGIDTPTLRARVERGRDTVPAGLTRLIELTRDNAAQQLRIGRLSTLLEQRLLLVERQLQVGPEQDDDAIQSLIAGLPIRQLADEIVAEEQALLADRDTRSTQLQQRTELVGWLAMLAQLVLLGIVLYLAQRQIGERLNAERAQRRASDRAQAVLQTVREPIVLADADQRVVMFNPAFAEVYGLDQAAIGQPLASVGNGAWSDVEFGQRLRDVLVRGREMWDFERAQTTADGATRTVLINARRMPLPDSDDHVALMTVSDVTAQKAAEQRIHELNRQLEGKVDQVSDVNRELEAFSYSVSHDLRAPLRHIAGFADKLTKQLGEDADEKSLHYLGVISSSARRMSTLIDDLLVYSRLGRSAMRLQAVDMQSLLSETRALLDANAQSEHPDLRIDWRIAPLPMLVADENMMRQVWLNLLGNAVKYSARRDVAVIEVGHERSDDGSHLFTVRDNGAGFDMAYAGKLFGVFQRMHKASDFAGTGIGLASVRRVLLRHGGRIWAESAPDAGATFFFTLPATLDRPDADGATPSISRESTP